MSALEQPKKVTGGAFGRFLNEKRSAFTKECQGKPVTAVVKLASERFKALPEAERAVYEEKYTQAMDWYKKELEAFLAAGGEKKATKRKGEKGEEGAAKKRKKDVDAPKKPAGGAYGCYVAKHRAEFMEQTKGQPITAVSKLAGERWKQLGEAEKTVFQEVYTAKLAAYKAAMKDYVPPEEPEPKEDKKAVAKQAREVAKASKAAENEAKTEAKLAEKPMTATGKAKATAKAKSFGHGRGKFAAPAIELQATVVAKAETDGLKEKFIQLASRQDIIDSKKSQVAILKALQDSDGLLHPAKRALLGA